MYHFFYVYWLSESNNTQTLHPFSIYFLFSLPSSPALPPQRAQKAESGETSDSDMGEQKGILDHQLTRMRAGLIRRGPPNKRQEGTPPAVRAATVIVVCPATGAELHPL
jgi:hypothetical protein